MMKFEHLTSSNYILSKDRIGLKEFTPKEAVEGQPDKEHLFPHLWYQAQSFRSSITAFDTFIRYTEREENLPHPTTLPAWVARETFSGNYLCASLPSLGAAPPTEGWTSPTARRVGHQLGELWAWQGRKPCTENGSNFRFCSKKTSTRF